MALHATWPDGLVTICQLYLSTQLNAFCAPDRAGGLSTEELLIEATMQLLEFAGKKKGESKRGEVHWPFS